ncbi:MAG TPA: T9SS type A sorting domain-containing protein, partial [Candidatus Kapabacteria bacterium]|nr:T9SS type A sorting domain-containing protein [Candidatus Kapabacteria bacterium]
SLLFPNPPISSVIKEPSGVALNPGDIINPGDTILVQITVQKFTIGDTTVSIPITGKYDCSNLPIATVEVNAENVDLESIGWNAPDTYINCRHSDTTLVSIMNRGASAWQLDSIALVTSSSDTAKQFDLKDASGNLVQRLAFKNKSLAPGETVKIPSEFHPTMQGQFKITVAFYLDSAGKRDTILVNYLNGNGIAVQTAMTAANPDPNSPIVGWYVAKGADALSVPLRFTTTALVASADAKRVVFNVTYRQDLFQLNAKPNDFTPSNGYTGVVTNTVDNGGFETVTIDVTNTAGPITNLDVVGNLNFTVMVAKDTTSQFVISNVTYYDEAGNSICYIATDTIPGNYISQNLCGHTSIRNYLSGQLPTRIVSLSPNPVDATVSPVLDYIVIADNTPVKVEVFNLLGEIVHVAKSMTVTAAGEHQLPIGTLGLESGTYTVRLSTPTTSESALFVLHK